MDWSSYKILCDSPQVWSRWMLRQTLELLEGSPGEPKASSHPGRGRSGEAEGVQGNSGRPEASSRPPCRHPATPDAMDDNATACALLRRALAGEPLAKPPGHKGGDATDMFELRISAAQADAVVAVLREAKARDVRTSGTRHRGLGGFLEAWEEYRRFIAAGEQAPTVGERIGADASSPAPPAPC